ncbi:MAG: diguanylate cyclase domain-containing protein [Parashewanella sp.]
MLYSWRKPAFKDPETGVYNQIYFIEAFNREWQKHISKQQGLAILYLRTNMDETANPTPVLKSFTNIIQNKLKRNSDIVARNEKGHFTIGIFNVDDLGMKAVISRVSESIEEMKSQTQRQYNQLFDCRITAGLCTPSENKRSDIFLDKIETASDTLVKTTSNQLELVYWQ